MMAMSRMMTSGAKSVGMAVSAGWTAEQALALAAAIEGDSEHTMARAVRCSAEERDLTLAQVSDFTAIKGKGVRAIWRGQEAYIGGPRLLESLALSLPEPLASFEQVSAARGQSVVHLVLDGGNCGLEPTTVVDLSALDYLEQGRAKGKVVVRLSD